MASEIKVDTIVNAGGDNDSGIDLATNDKIGMKIANSEVVTVDTTGVVFNENSADRDFRVESDANTHGLFLEGSTGNVGIGTSSPLGLLHVSNTSGDCNNYFQSASTGLGQLLFTDGAIAGKISYRHPTNTMEFTTNGTEAMRLTSGGTFLVGSTTGTINSSNFGFRVDADGFTTFAKSAASSSSVLQVFGASGEFKIMGDGDAENTSGRYSSISDERYKENIVDASSQWNDIKAVRVRNYNFKEEQGWGTHTQIGVVAQELEASGMTGGLVKTNDDGYKSVATSVLYMKAVKALQEAMARIETLEAKVTALESE